MSSHPNLNSPDREMTVANEEQRDERDDKHSLSPPTDIDGGEHSPAVCGCDTESNDSGDSSDPDDFYWEEEGSPVAEPQPDEDAGKPLYETLLENESFLKSRKTAMDTLYQLSGQWLETSEERGNVRARIVSFSHLPLPTTARKHPVGPC